MNSDNPIPSPEVFGLNKDTVAYVRSVAASDLGDDIETPDGVDTLYALHDAAGRRLALFDNREFAFQIAKQNDLNPVSVH